MAARVNNDGRKLYQLAKYQEAEVVPDERAVNFITVDYFGASSAGPLPIDVVDACNRLNFERLGIDWKSSLGFWELYPHEGDGSRIELTGRAAALTAEVNGSIDAFKNEVSVDGHEKEGRIVSTGCDAAARTWRRLPEWALDDDFFTRWCGAGGRSSHGWGIDLGERKAVDEIAIAWEIPNYRPGYTVYASNDDSRFADGISEAELLDDAGWVEVASSAEISNVVLLWDQKQFQDIGVHEWRYVKIRIGDSDVKPSFCEVRLYGPAK